MKRQLQKMLAALAAAALFLGGTAAQGQEPDRETLAPPAPDTGAAQGVEVLTRGPVHEAFAAPVVRAPAPSPVVAKRPPDPIEEVPPDMKPEGDNVVWAPGYWAWAEDQQNFVWVSGTWRIPPPGRQWTPGYWTQVEGGSQWVSGFWASTEQADVQLLPEPPEPVAEAPPPRPAETSQYTPGCWIWRETRYAWRPGYWIEPQPGWVWASAGYTWTPAGYVFIDGHWDYALRDRGLLFAPVLVDQSYWGRPGWSYRPSYVVSDNFLLGALFVRLDSHRYCFGDYFESRYREVGFVPWVDFRVAGRYYDPLLSYYAWNNRGNPGWITDLRQVYAGRYGGDIPRPPRTLIQQTTIVNNTTINNVTINNNINNNITNIRTLRAVTPLSGTGSSFARLQRVPQIQAQQYRATTTQFRELSQERRRLDTQLRQQGQVAMTTSRPVALPLTRPQMVSRPTQAAHAPPPLPTLPRPMPTAPSGAMRPEPGRTPERGALAPGDRQGGMVPRDRLGIVPGDRGNPAVPGVRPADETGRKASPTDPRLPTPTDRRVTPGETLRPSDQRGRAPNPLAPQSDRPVPSQQQPGRMPAPPDRRVVPADERPRPPQAADPRFAPEPRRPAPEPRMPEPRAPQSPPPQMPQRPPQAERAPDRPVPPPQMPQRPPQAERAPDRPVPPPQQPPGNPPPPQRPGGKDKDKGPDRR